MVDEFQHRVYAEPDLTPAGRNAVWLELEAKYRPHIDQRGIPYLERGTRWQYQMHIYETPFYYIDYCLAQTAAFQFLLASQDDYADAFARYLHLSEQGGEKALDGAADRSRLPLPRLRRARSRSSPHRSSRSSAGKTSEKRRTPRCTN